MSMPINHDTRTKILGVAKVLFAKNGFEGTSVRDIASAAGVNVAAINYHFNNKQGLYFEIVRSNFAWMEEKLAEIRGKESIRVVDFVPKMLQFYRDEGHALLISFKMMMEDSVTIPSDGPMVSPDDLGPPGGKTLLELITGEVGESIPMDARRWAMSMIFRQTVHTGIVLNSSVIKARCDKAYQNLETTQLQLAIHAEAILEFIKKHPQRWA